MHKHFESDLIICKWPTSPVSRFSDFSSKENINLIDCLLMSNFSKENLSFTGLSSKSIEIQDAKLEKFCKYVSQEASTWPHLHLLRWIGTFWSTYYHEFAKGSYETLQISLSLPDKLIRGCVFLWLSKNTKIGLYYVSSSKWSTFKMQPFINGCWVCCQRLFPTL